MGLGQCDRCGPGKTLCKFCLEICSKSLFEIFQKTRAFLLVVRIENDIGVRDKNGALNKWEGLTGRIRSCISKEGRSLRRKTVGENERDRTEKKQGAYSHLTGRMVLRGGGNGVHGF